MKVGKLYRVLRDFSVPRPVGKVARSKNHGISMSSAIPVAVQKDDIILISHVDTIKNKEQRAHELVIEFLHKDKYVYKVYGDLLVDTAEGLEASYFKEIKS
jgi:hypothetical protein